MSPASSIIPYQMTHIRLFMLLSVWCMLCVRVSLYTTIHSIECTKRRPGVTWNAALWWDCGDTQHRSHYHRLFYNYAPHRARIIYASLLHCIWRRCLIDVCTNWKKKKHIVDLTTSYLRLMRLLCPHSTVHSIPSFGFDCAHVGDCDDVQNMDLFLCLRKTTH